MTERTCPPCPGDCMQGRRCPYKPQFLQHEAEDQSKGPTPGEWVFIGIVTSLCLMLGIALVVTAVRALA